MPPADGVRRLLLPLSARIVCELDTLLIIPAELGLRKLALLVITSAAACAASRRSWGKAA